MAGWLPNWTRRQYWSRWYFCLLHCHRLVVTSETTRRSTTRHTEKEKTFGWVSDLDRLSVIIIIIDFYKDRLIVDRNWTWPDLHKIKVAKNWRFILYIFYGWGGGTDSLSRSISVPPPPSVMIFLCYDIRIQLRYQTAFIRAANAHRMIVQGSERRQGCSQQLKPIFVWLPILIIILLMKSQ